MKKLRNPIKALAVAGLLVLMLSGLTQLTTLKNYIACKISFFQQDHPYDVLFLGNSHVLNAVNPLVLWQQDGIVSYNLGFSAHNLDQLYSVAQYAADKAHPQLLVVDLYKTGQDAGVLATDPKDRYMHKSFDCVPFSLRKFQMVNQYFTGFEEKLEYLFPFTLYHSRWSSLEALDFNIPQYDFKGFGTSGTVGYAEQYPTQTEAAVLPDCLSVRAFHNFVDYCKNKNIALLFTLLPFPATEEQQQLALAYAALCEQYDVPFLNFLELRGIVDYKVDLTATDGSSTHLNTSGAQKASAYLSTYLKQHYSLPDRRDSAAYANWHDDYAYYKAQIQSSLQTDTDVTSALLQLHDPTLDFTLCYRRTPGVAMGETLANLLKNLGATDAVLAGQGEEYYLLCNRGLSQPMEGNLSASQQTPAVIGGASFAAEGGGVTVSCQGTHSLTMAPGDCLLLLVFDHDTGVLYVQKTLPLEALNLTDAPEPE